MDYNKLFEKARKVYAECVTNAEKRKLESVFPELAQSEDERLRTDIISYLQHESQVKRFIGDIEYDKWLAWLEKQGEQKQKQYDIDVFEKHITKDSISDLAHTIIVRNGWEIVDAKEQKPAWSEEDEKYINDILAILGGGRGYRSNRQIEEWLKSLKPHWKPTDEQIHCFKCVIDFYKTKVNDTIVLNLLNSLYNNLKKL